MFLLVESGTLYILITVSSTIGTQSRARHQFFFFSSGLNLGLRRYPRALWDSRRHSHARRCTTRSAYPPLTIITQGLC